MKTSLFDFDLPPERIATAPVSPRDSSRMLVVGDSLQDKKITDLLEFLQPGDVMVFNDTKVIPARLMGKRDGAKIEVLLHKLINDSSLRGGEADVAIQCQNVETPGLLRYARNDANIWQCFAKPAKKLKIGDIVSFADDFNAEVLQKYADGQVLLAFKNVDFEEKLEKYGAMPLPPYIEKSRHADASDNANYQTVYAQNSGSVAAPTAGLHFTEKLLAAIDKSCVKRVHVTLHVGGGTFIPVKVDDTSEHVMHSEYAVVSKEVADIINSAKRVIAVGTTSVRTLESAANEQGLVQPFSGETNIFITPGYKFKVVDVMLTNFHLPKSTLFMLVSAFSGLDKMQAAYAHAIAQNYRFYSYGDACLLFNA